MDPKRLYVSLTDADSGEELMRVTPLQEGNGLEPQLINASSYVGRRAKVRVVDDARGEWGHINFGGLYRDGSGE